MSLDAAQDDTTLTTTSDDTGAGIVADSSASQSVASPPQDGAPVDSATSTGASLSATPPIYERLGLPAESFQGLSEEDQYRAIGQQLQERQRLEQQVQQYQPYAQYGYQYRQHEQAFQQFLQQQGQQQAPRAEEAAEQKPFWEGVWNPPQFKPETADLWMDHDPVTGAVTGWKSNTPAEVIQGHHEYQQYRRDAAEKFWSNPHEFIRQSPAMDDFRQDLLAQVTEQVRAEFASQNVIQDVSQFERQNAGWLYQTDPAGQVMRDPMTGSAVPSQAGQLFLGIVAELREAGIQDPYQLQKLALRQTHGEILRLTGGAGVPGGSASPAIPAPQVPATPAQALAATNRQFNQQNNSAARNPSRAAGAATQGAPATTPGLSLEDRMLSRFREHNLIGSSN